MARRALQVVNVKPYLVSENERVKLSENDFRVMRDYIRILWEADKAQKHMARAGGNEGNHTGKGIQPRARGGRPLTGRSSAAIEGLLLA